MILFEFAKAVEEGNGYEFISQRYEEFTKTELVGVIKEYDYAIYDGLNSYDSSLVPMMRECVADGVRENLCDTEDK